MSEPFYSRNSLRRYPLVVGSDLPLSFLVDAGFTVYQDAGFLPSAHQVRVTRAERTTGGWTVTVAGPAAVAPLSFFAPDGWGEWLTVWDDAGQSGASSSSGSGGVPVSWFGFLVFGREADWQELLPSGALVPADGRFEPARTAISRGLVRAVRLADRERLRVSDPACGPTSGSGSTSTTEELPTSVDRPYREWPSDLTAGRLELVEGYNLSVRLRDGLVTLAARPGYGDGEVCEEVPVTPDEAPPSGSALLTGGPACGDLVRTVNGLPGRTILASGGKGVFVTDDAAASTVYFDVDPSVIAPATSSSSAGV